MSMPQIILLQYPSRAMLTFSGELTKSFSGHRKPFVFPTILLTLMYLIDLNLNLNHHIRTCSLAQLLQTREQNHTLLRLWLYIRGHMNRWVTHWQLTILVMSTCIICTHGPMLDPCVCYPLWCQRAHKRMTMSIISWDCSWTHIRKLKTTALPFLNHVLSLIHVTIMI